MRILETHWIGRSRLGKKLAEFLERTARWCNASAVIPPLQAFDGGDHVEVHVEHGYQALDFALRVDNDAWQIQSGVVQIGAVATTVDALTISTTQQDYWVQMTRTAAGVWTVNTTLQAGAIGTLFADSGGAWTLKYLIGTMASGGWTQRHTNRIVIGPANIAAGDGISIVDGTVMVDYGTGLTIDGTTLIRDPDDYRVATNGDDSTPDYLLAKHQDAGTYDSGTDILVKAEAVNNSGNRKVRLHVPGDSGDSICALLKSLPGYDAGKILIPMIVNGVCSLIEINQSCDCWCCIEDPDYSNSTWDLYDDILTYTSAANLCAAQGPGTYKKVTFNGTTRWYASLDDVMVAWDGDTVDDCTWLQDDPATGGAYCGAADSTVLSATDGVTSCNRDLAVTAPSTGDMTVEDEVCS